MLKSIRYRLLVIGLLIGVSASGSAQQITEGVFEFGLISHKIIKDSVDEATLAPIIEQLTQGIPDMKIYFTPNRVAVVNKDRSGSEVRGVIDLEKRKEYSFSNIAEIASFAINDFDPEIGRPIPINKEYGAGKQLDEKVFDLNCTQYTTTNSGSTVTLITTNDIAVPDSTMLNSMLTEDGFMVSTKITDTNLGLSYTIGLKSFSPVISDRSILSIDTTGMTNMTQISEGFLEAIEEDKN